MTTYILTGGWDHLYPNYLENLAKFILQQKPEPRILQCAFAKPENEQSELYNIFEPLFYQYFGEDVEVENANIDHYLEQLERADVFYIHGGELERLLEILPDAATVRRLFANKIIIGSSAGAMYLAAKSIGYYSENGMNDGAGVLPVGVLVHYGAIANDRGITMDYWRKSVQDLIDVLPDDMLVLPLTEGSMTIIERAD
ncbi:Type 1 glutamine amidotransferase-like domain-containing protein [Candidatus Saccharibacteria bacterium]|nr:Type 1 glutamine amidotransferase-like domain-containing protein [Candidatus Saccharibacteria bacterium]